MDNLTHGLFGLAVAALRRPDGGSGPASATDKAVVAAALLASELPDLDSLWPAPNAVMNALQAHRGLSHSLFAAPLIALVAALAARLLFRGARLGVVYGYSLAAVILAHLVPDLWTGWGTRVLLPLSGQRFSWDLTMVVDPFVTLPLLAGALWGWRRRERWRQGVLTGLAVVLLYLLARGGVQTALQARVEASYPQAQRVAVFPTWLGMTQWRYVAVLDAEHAAGAVALTGAPEEQRRQPRPEAGVALPAEVLAIPSVAEAVHWARFPLVGRAVLADGSQEVRIADLRYHLRGEPTLTYVFRVGADLSLQEAWLDRGGTAGQLLKRWRND